MYAVTGIALLAIAKSVIQRIIPFYRRELQIESVARLTPLDGLRGILCFGVMYYHAAITHGLLTTGRWEETPSAFYVLLGQTSVAFFFCITGFLFWSRTLDRQGNIPPFAFLRGRWFRVVPLYVFTAIIALVMIRKQIHWSRHATWLALGKMSLIGLGMVSYSVYLLHGIFLYEGRPILHTALADGDLAYWRMIFIFAAVVPLFCCVTYRLIEWPFIRLEKRMRGFGFFDFRVSSRRF